jgi:hypothetical protein
VAREGIEPPTRGFSDRTSNARKGLNRSVFWFDHCGIF